MHRRTYIRYTLSLAAGGTLVLWLALWRLGLAPVYAWLIGVNGMTLLLYGYDKRQATAGRSRVPELVLHLAALCGGSPGALLAQGLFHHKTRKRGFQVVLAMIVLLQIAAFYGSWRFLRGGS